MNVEQKARIVGATGAVVLAVAVGIGFALYAGWLQ